MGENITFADIQTGRPVVVISEGVQNRLFDGRNPLEETIKGVCYKG